MDKTQELFGLHKVPDKIIIKELLKEKGQLLSYIDELEHTIAALKNKSNKIMKKEMFNTNYGLTDSVINGRKTKTRRICSIQRPSDDWEIVFPILEHLDNPNCRSGAFAWRNPITKEFTEWCNPRYKVGDIVAVAQSYSDIGFAPDDIMYRDVDGRFIKTLTCDMAGWSNKMFVKAEHMPHQIQITDIGIQKLQNISDDDCIAEGIMYIKYIDKYYFERKDKDEGFYFDTPREAFASLIDKVCGKGTWESNPWVFVYEFKLIK